MSVGGKRRPGKVLKMKRGRERVWLVDEVRHLSVRGSDEDGSSDVFGRARGLPPHGRRFRVSGLVEGCDRLRPAAAVGGVHRLLVARVIGRDGDLGALEDAVVVVELKRSTLTGRGRELEGGGGGEVARLRLSDQGRLDLGLGQQVQGVVEVLSERLSLSLRLPGLISKALGFGSEGARERTGQFDDHAISRDEKDLLLDEGHLLELSNPDLESRSVRNEDFTSAEIKKEVVGRLTRLAWRLGASLLPPQRCPC